MPGIVFAECPSVSLRLLALVLVIHTPLVSDKCDRSEILPTVVDNWGQLLLNHLLQAVLADAKENLYYAGYLAGAAKTIGRHC